MSALEHPLNLLEDPMAFVAWQREVGPDEAQRQLNAAARAHMEKHGSRSAIEIVDKADDAIARLEEFAV